MPQPSPTHTPLAYALAYARRGWHVFPCYEWAGDRCACDDGASCGNGGKHPRVSTGFKAATTDPDQIREWWTRWPRANVAIATGASRLVVVDVDPRNGGDESMRDLETEHGRLPDTIRAVTGGGGSHELFAAPDVPRVPSRVIADGVDIKAHGGYVIAAPSTHSSGGTYEWDAGAHPGDAELAPCPEWIVRRLAQPTTTKHEPATGAVTDGVIGKAFELLGWLGRAVGPDRMTARCPWEDEHTSGKRHDSSTVVYAPRPGSRVGWLYCLHSHCQHRTAKDVLAIIPAPVVAEARAALEISPSWSPEQEAVPTPLTGEGAWESSLRRNQSGTLTREPGNAALLVANLDEWRGCLQYDEFADQIRWARPAPSLAGFAPPDVGADLADHHVTYVQHWLARHHDVAFPKQSVHDAVESAARQNTVHPVREYLTGLEWDGTLRLDSWLVDYLGADPALGYVAAVSRWWLVGAVARVMRPGCQADHILVLEGDQGAGKSTAVRILGGDWYLASLPDLGSKDASQILQGSWLVEMGELDALRGAAMTRVKDYITRTVDSYRPAYGRSTVRRPRQCVFIGTTNEHTYLQDSSGARRFWPIRVSAIDAAGLRSARDQLWAEAVARYEAGEQWHPSATFVPALTEAQDERFAADAWEPRIAAWAAERSEFTLGSVMADALGIEPGRWTRGDQTRVGMVLRRLGYTSRRVMVAGVREVRYCLPTFLPT